MSKLLQNHLQRLHANDLFLLGNSDELVNYLSARKKHRGTVACLFNSRGRAFLLPPVGRAFIFCRRAYRGVWSHWLSECGLPFCWQFRGEYGFIFFYCHVVFDQGTFLQKDGVCIGARIAHLLSDLVWSGVGNCIFWLLDNTYVANLFRFVNDFIFRWKDSSLGWMAFL